MGHSAATSPNLGAGNCLRPTLERPVPVRTAAGIKEASSDGDATFSTLMGQLSSMSLARCAAAGQEVSGCAPTPGNPR